MGGSGLEVYAGILPLGVVPALGVANDPREQRAGVPCRVEPLGVGGAHLGVSGFKACDKRAIPVDDPSHRFERQTAILPLSMQLNGGPVVEVVIRIERSLIRHG